MKMDKGLHYRRYRRLYRQMLTTYRPIMMEALNRQKAAFITHYENTGESNSSLISNKPVLKAITSLHLVAGISNTRSNYRALKQSLGRKDWMEDVETKGNSEQQKRWEWIIEKYFREHLLDKVVDPITETTKKEILDILIQANSEGWGVDKTVRALKNSDITRQRAELIVRTESMRASNVGAMIAAADLNVAVMKEWLSANDNRTRRIPRDNYDHVHMSGKQVQYNEAFIVPSLKTIDIMQFPGDPNGSAGNVCNCRCTVIFEPIRNNAGRPVSMDEMPSNGGGSIIAALVREAASLFITQEILDQIFSHEPDYTV